MAGGVTAAGTVTQGDLGRLGATRADSWPIYRLPQSSGLPGLSLFLAGRGLPQLAWDLVGRLGGKSGAVSAWFRPGVGRGLAVDRC